jgi:hypothetical protein
MGIAPTEDLYLCTAHVESRCGAVAVGWAYLWPALSVAGASLALPWPRFHIPLIELDVRISRIQLSDRTLHSLRSRSDYGGKLAEFYQSQVLVQVSARVACVSRPGLFVLLT